jgi:hypothetical protein
MVVRRGLLIVARGFLLRQRARRQCGKRVQVSTGRRGWWPLVGAAGEAESEVTVVMSVDSQGPRPRAHRGGHRSVWRPPCRSARVAVLAWSVVGPGRSPHAAAFEFERGSRIAMRVRECHTAIVATAAMGRSL